MRFETVKSLAPGLRCIGLLSILAGALFSCQGRKVGKIAEKIGEACPVGKGCSVRIGDVPPFQWGRIYVFNNDAEREQIQEALGVSSSELDHGPMLVFVRSGRIVYTEHEPFNGG